jgi:hypothetical protein
MADSQQAPAPANPPTANAAAHTATGGLAGLAAGYLTMRRGLDPWSAAAIVGVVGGLFGRVGSWANDQLAGGSTSLIVRLLSSWG